MSRILVVDDELRYCQILDLMLRHENHEVVTTTDGQHAARLIDEQEIDVIISDLFMSPYSGTDLLRHRNVVAPEIPFIVLTAFGTIPSAVETVREGAFDYLTKPFQEDTILATVRNALKVRVLSEENRNLKQLLRESLGETPFLGNTNSVKALMERMVKVAPTDLTVLILGETGTGKDLLARQIHRLSAHKDGPFVKVNCAAIPASLLESELFGYEKGAFSGATHRHKGRFQMAHGGTLFLDEVGELDPSLQAKFLQAIEEKKFYPLGGSSTVQVNCRILAASNRPLEEMVKKEKFRQDLFHRLMAFPVHIPPLRDRREDIRILVDHYLRVFGNEMGSREVKFEPRALDFLLEYQWPGNVREVMNVLRSAVLMNGGGIIGLESFPLHLLVSEESEAEDPQPEIIAPDNIPTLAQAEKELIQKALQVSGGNKSRAARLLGISRSHLRYRMMLHEI